MADTADIVATYGAMQRRAVMQTSVTVQRLWAELASADLSGSWVRGVGPAVVRAVAAGQLVAASSGQTYVDAMVAADGLTSDYMDGADTVDAGALSGIAADGRDLESLLYLPVIRTKTLIQGGLTLQEALLGGLVDLQRMVASEVADAGSGAAGVAMAANRRVKGYVRQVRAGACARCAILAGRWYRYNADFARHKRCFPAGVVVSGPRTLAATRRSYDGELVILTTAGGQELPATGNHPILTRRGWVAANLVQEGDEVVRSLRPQGAAPLVVPDHQQMPARIEDVWDAHSMAGVLRGVPTTSEDFHGDGGHGEVDVVGPNRFLWGGAESTLLKHAVKELLAFGPAGMPRVSLAGLGFDREALGGWGFATDRVVGRRSQLGAAGGVQVGHPERVGLGLATEVYPCCLQVPTYDGPHDAISASDGLLALASRVSRDDLGFRQDDDAPRWDALGSPGSVEDAATDTRVGQDLLQRLAGQVELDRVVDVRRVRWIGHVYDLNSTEGWFSANGLIVSNCQCYGVPATDARPGTHGDPMAFFDGLSRAEQDRRFGASGAQAIRDGADIYQVVNASRSVQTLDQFGRRVLATLEGTSSRGDWYRTIRGLDEERAGVRFARGVADLEQGLPRYQLRTARLMPGELYKLAEDRDELIRLLRRFGYLQ